MYKLVVYKKNKGCSQCAVLDKLTPTMQAKYPQVQWDYVVFDQDNPIELPEYVRAFPTSVLYKDDDQVFVHGGYEGLAKKIHETLNS